ncbi:hypothetical protein Nepgr_031073 [Nepenthes gracilis]|uniref:H15 domain-containing protein n=1 Tax=Nepenthes gracilis TaxID=150966 RepID=A0AAD3TGL5_NEPGR|nr:hypothetical protein Nepgr_031073 [Nepenthes gracilis]
MASAAKKSKAPPQHPPYIAMIKEALISLKERTGSSHYAIAKHMEEQQKVALPSNFRKLLSVQLKKLVASGKLVKVKNSFKIPPLEKKSSVTESKPKSKPKEGTVKNNAAKAKPKVVAVKKARVAAKPKSVVKAKSVAKPKTEKVVKSTRTVTVKSPARKMAAAKVRKAVEKPKKPKSIKTPVKKAPAAAKKAKN